MIIAYNSFFDFQLLLAFSSKLITLIFFAFFIFIYKLPFYKGIFVQSIKLILLSFFLSIIPCLFLTDQSLLESLIAISEYSYFLIYFFLLDTKLNKEIIVKTILAFAYIGMVLFCFQFLNPETVYFGGGENFIEQRGLIRILFPGEGFMFFALFYYLNKIGKEMKIFHMIALILFIIMMSLQVTRIYFVSFGLIAIYHLMFRTKRILKVFTLFFFLLFYFIINNSENKVVNELLVSSKEDVANDDYIRFIELDYYFFHFTNEKITYLLGNGADYYKSKYGQKISGLRVNQNYYLEDLGIYKGYFLFGIFFVIGYFIIFFKSFEIKTPLEMSYIKYYIWMILILSFTTRANTNAAYGTVLAVVLYLYEDIGIKKSRLLYQNLKANFN